MPKEAITKDTIAAIATAQGIGALGVVRLSGSEAPTIVEKFFKSNPPLTKLEPWRAALGKIIGDSVVDWAVAIKYEAPKSFTGEDMVEIMTHGSPLILRKVLGLAFSNGAREALPGEFTQRAFLNGKVDLVQAEAIAGLIRSNSSRAARTQGTILSGLLSRRLSEVRDGLVEALAEIDVITDHPDEPEVLQDFSPERLGVLISKARSQLLSLTQNFKDSYKLREGFSVVIVGAPNAGKSTLFNGLLNKNKAIVSAEAGTTRDVLEGFLEMRGALVRLVDTAGISKASDPLSREGRRRAEEAIANSDYILWVIDGAKADLKEEEILRERLARKTTIIVWNKKDLPGFSARPEAFNGNFSAEAQISIAAAQGEGLDEIRNLLLKNFQNSLSDDGGSGFWEERQALLAEEAVGFLGIALEKLKMQSWELSSFEIRAAIEKIDTILGKGEIAEDVLRKIFSKFCVGK